MSDLEVRENGTIAYDGLAVGKIDEEEGTRPQLTVNLGWAKAAGLSVRVLADPEVDHKRGGIVLDR